MMKIYKYANIGALSSVMLVCAGVFVSAGDKNVVLDESASIRLGSLEEGVPKPPLFGLGMGVGYFRQSMPVNDLQMGFGSMNLEPSDIELSGHISHDTLLLIKGDLHPLPFLSLYGLLGYTSARSDVRVTTPEINTEIPVTINVPIGDGSHSIPIKRSIPIEIPSQSTEIAPQQHGLAWGGGLTLSGTWNVFFASLDTHYVWADYESDLQLRKGTMTAFSASPRLGASFPLPSEKGALKIWTGVMYMEVEKTFDGDIPIDNVQPELAAAFGSSIAYHIESKTTDPWNYLVGLGWAMGENWLMELEVGLGEREHILAGVKTRF